jgi:hypothetical protein
MCRLYIVFIFLVISCSCSKNKPNLSNSSIKIKDESPKERKDTTEKLNIEKKRLKEKESKKQKHAEEKPLEEKLEIKKQKQIEERQLREEQEREIQKLAEEKQLREEQEREIQKLADDERRAQEDILKKAEKEKIERDEKDVEGKKLLIDLVKDDANDILNNDENFLKNNISPGRISLLEEMHKHPESLAIDLNRMTIKVGDNEINIAEKSSFEAYNILKNELIKYLKNSNINQDLKTLLGPNALGRFEIIEIVYALSQQFLAPLQKEALNHQTEKNKVTWASPSGQPGSLSGRFVLQSKTKLVVKLESKKLMWRLGSDGQFKEANGVRDQLMQASSIFDLASGTLKFKYEYSWKDPNSWNLLKNISKTWYSDRIF